MTDGHANRHLLPAAAVAVCGAMWGLFWLPLRLIEAEGVGGGWISLIFNALGMLSALPWLLRRSAWHGFGDQMVNGMLLGTAFSLYTVSLVMTDVIHAILLFYMTPVWSTLGGWLLFRERLTGSRMLALVMGFAGLAAVLGVSGGLPLPRNMGDGLALISGMFWAAGTMRSFRRPAEGIALPVFSFSLGGFISATVILLVAALLSFHLAAGQNLLPMMPWIILFGLAFYVPPNFLVLWAAQRIDSARVGILLMTEVLFGTLSAAILSGEAFGVSIGIGTALIVSAALIEVFRR
jgi:drug/metabolite transporter (DMT)-like permease